MNRYIWLLVQFVNIDIDTDDHEQTSILIVLIGKVL